MTKSEIIAEIARSGIVEELISKVKSSREEPQFNLDDLAQDIYLDLLEKDEEKIQHLWESGEWKFFIAKMITNNLNSNTSRYDRQYRRDILPLPQEG